MVNIIEKHRMLRLDLINEMNIDGDTNKIFYLYENSSDWPNGFMFAEFKNQFVFVKDCNQKTIHFYNDFFQKIKLIYSFLELNTDDYHVLNDIISFFKTNKSIAITPTDTPFNPYKFAADCQFQVIDKPFKISIIEASIENIYAVEPERKNNSSN